MSYWPDLLLLLHLHLLLHAELVALLYLLHGLHSLLGVHLVQLGLDARGDGDLLLLPWVNHSLLLGLLVLHLDHLWVALLLHQLLLLGVTLLNVLLLHVLGRHLVEKTKIGCGQILKFLIEREVFIYYILFSYSTTRRRRRRR